MNGHGKSIIEGGRGEEEKETEIERERERTTISIFVYLPCSLIGVQTTVLQVSHIPRSYQGELYLGTKTDTGMCEWGKLGLVEAIISSWVLY